MSRFKHMHEYQCHHAMHECLLKKRRKWKDEMGDRKDKLKTTFLL